jgi:hypothetical protein
VANALAPKAKPFDYDTTQARRQAKRRALFNRMRAALQKIEEATALDEAKAIARDGLSEDFFNKEQE